MGRPPFLTLAGADGAGRSTADVVDSLLREGEDVLDEIEALEVAKARLEAELLAAYGALHTIEAQQVRALARRSPAARSAMVSPDRVVAEEIALATGVGVGEVGRRLALATAPRRHRALLTALRGGETTLHRALQVSSDTAHLDDADVAVVAAEVLAPRRGRSGESSVVPQRTFAARLRRAIASVDRRSTEERRSRARVRRGVFGRMVEDGMGCLTVTADAATVAAVMDRLDAAARGLRSGGDPRTLDQLRCDLATHALLGGSAGGVEDAGDEPPTGRAAARVWLVVPFEVADGTSDAACEVPGHGWLTAAHAREVMTRPGSVWQTLPVDVASGHAISRPSRGYRPGREVLEHVRAVDGSCRGPDCHVPAARCDLDHETPWPMGGTTVENVFAKHRLHHNLKTGGVWTSRPAAGPGRALTWTTLVGRTYTTHPKDWREGVAQSARGPGGRGAVRDRSGPERPPF